MIGAVLLAAVMFAAFAYVRTELPRQWAAIDSYRHRPLTLNRGRRASDRGQA